LLLLELRVRRFFGAWRVPSIWVQSCHESNYFVFELILVCKRLKLLN
jgi:hypothetical protein